MNPGIMEYVALAKTAISGGARLWKAYRAHALSKREAELLVAAARSGEFFLLTAGQLPAPIVRAGATTFSDENDPAVAAHYRDGFRSLIHRGYVEHVADQRFTLTGDGFEKARSLAS